MLISACLRGVGCSRYGPRGIQEEAKLREDARAVGRRRPRRRRKKNAALFFCVQKHLASHLHYDFRLEWNGVLLSWAVPKGPSLNPADKRLAMHVEDHPIEYGTFEGVIPEGYGAGIVMLWDRGTWEPETDDVDAALKKGDLKFRLDGFKLKGSWVLVRTRGYYGESSQRGAEPGRSWLLIKHRDDWAGPDRHHDLRAAQREDARRRSRRHSRRGQSGHLAEQCAGKGRRHRPDVSADHRAGAGDSRGQSKARYEGREGARRARRKHRPRHVHQQF